MPRSTFQQQLLQNKAVLKFESITFKKAHYQNYVLDEHTKLVKKIIEQERAKVQDELDKERRRLEAELDRIRMVKQPDSQDLFDFQDERRRVVQDVCLHIVYCYLKRQDKNKIEWNRSVNSGQMAERPLKTPENFEFIRNSFPEVLCLSEEEIPWKDKTNSDIYENGRSPHDLKCLSTRSEAIGVTSGTYPVHKPINVRQWKPLNRWGATDSSYTLGTTCTRYTAEPYIPPSLNFKCRGANSRGDGERLQLPNLPAQGKFVIPQHMITAASDIATSGTEEEFLELINLENALSKFKELAAKVQDDIIQEARSKPAGRERRRLAVDTGTTSHTNLVALMDSHNTHSRKNLLRKRSLPERSLRSDSCTDTRIIVPEKPKSRCRLPDIVKQVAEKRKTA